MGTVKRVAAAKCIYYYVSLIKILRRVATSDNVAIIRIMMKEEDNVCRYFQPVLQLVSRQMRRVYIPHHHHPHYHQNIQQQNQAQLLQDLRQHHRAYYHQLYQPNFLRIYQVILHQQNHQQHHQNFQQPNPARRLQHLPQLHQAHHRLHYQVHFHH